MDAQPYTPEEIHAFTEHYIHACSNQGHPFHLPKDDQDRMAYILAAVMDSIREKSGQQSRWEPAQLYATKQALAHFVVTTMEKTGARCQLTFHAGSVSMQFSLPHMSELPSMDNRFWSELADVINREKITYFSGELHDVISKSETNKQITKFVKAPLFAFLTEFHICYQHDPETVMRLGDFEKSIFYMDSSWPEIIDTLSGIFRVFTRLSQSLYRSYYIKASNDPKRRLGLSNLETVTKIFSWIQDQNEAWTPEDVAAAFPEATKIDIQAAHDVAMKRDIISGIGKPFRVFSPTNPKQ